MLLDLPALLFWMVASLTGICAIGVVVTRSIVRSATWLLFTLAGTSGVFFLLGADFVAATQLLVYVGGTLVLVVFGVMLTAQGPFVNLKTGAVEWAFSVVVGLALLAVLSLAILGRPANSHEAVTAMKTGGPATSRNSEILGEALLGVREATPDAWITGMPEGSTLQRRKPMGYLLPFEIVSVHLLVVLIGAAYLARAKRRRGVVRP